MERSWGRGTNERLHFGEGLVGGACLLGGEVDEVVSLIDKEDLEGCSGHVMSPRVNLPQVRDGNLEICAVPCTEERQ